MQFLDEILSLNLLRAPFYFLFWVDGLDGDGG